MTEKCEHPRWILVAHRFAGRWGKQMQVQIHIPLMDSFGNGLQACNSPVEQVQTSLDQVMTAMEASSERSQ